MKLGRTSTVRAIARCLACAVVLAQVFIAAHACPRLAAAAHASSVRAAVMAGAEATGDVHETAASGATVGCAGMIPDLDLDATNLCVEHCRAGQQSPDVPTSAISPPLLTCAYGLVPEPIPVPPSRPCARTLDALVSASPPLAILHCVYRL